jgi:hypothetical protein
MYLVRNCIFAFFSWKFTSRLQHACSKEASFKNFQFHNVQFPCNCDFTVAFQDYNVVYITGSIEGFAVEITAIDGKCLIFPS